MALPVIFLAVLLGGFFFPWWWPALAAYAAAYWLGGKGRSSWRATLSGFLGTAAAWGGLAAYMDWRNDHLLAARMAELFHLPSPWLLPALTALIGGLMGGLGAWAGRSLKLWIVDRRKQDGLGPV